MPAPLSTTTPTPARRRAGVEPATRNVRTSTARSLLNRSPARRLLDVDAYVRELLATIALQHAPVISGQREAGLLYLKLLHWVKKYGTFPRAAMVRQIAHNLAIDLLRAETRQRINAEGVVVSGLGRGVTFISLDEPGEGCAPGVTLGDAIPAPAPPRDPREAWEFEAAHLIAAALRAVGPTGRRLSERKAATHQRDCAIIARVLGGEPAVDLARAHHLTASRISQIIRQATLTLRRHLAA